MNPKTKKLLSRPIEEDTTIEMEHIVEFKALGCEALMELWNWDGISASSVIFLKEDVGKYGDEKLLELASIDLPSLKEGRTTFKRVGDYIYINFGFKS
ncbi:MAG: hypothetical protein KC478_13075 [Bacteriovoracaceae bacterium]|nr:hypothetical protein [Bacteriovoracaceae bacterium]